MCQAEASFLFVFDFTCMTLTLFVIVVFFKHRALVLIGSAVAATNVDILSTHTQSVTII